MQYGGERPICGKGRHANCNFILNKNFYGPISLTEKILPGFNKNGKIIFAGGFVGKLDQIGSEELKKRFKSESLSKDELSALME